VAIGTGAKVNSPFHLGDFKAYTTPIVTRVIFSLTYGNGLFVAALFGGITPNKVMTSPDGINWTIRQAGTAGTEIGWVGATFGVPTTGIYQGQGLFVAVGYAGTNRLMTSPDGINWIVRASAGVLDAYSWSNVIFANGYFVAACSNSINVAYSQDGITWVLVALPSAIVTNWRIAFGNGVFVAVGNTTGSLTNRIYRNASTPNTTWTGYSAPADNSWVDITYGDGLFVAVSTTGTGNRVMTSPNGITWTLRSTPVDYTFQGITFGNGLFVATTENTNNFITSPDGINWTIKPIPYTYGAYGWRSICYGLVNGIGTFVTFFDMVSQTSPNVMVASFADSNNLNSVAIGQSAYANGGNSITIGNSARVSGQQLSDFVPRATPADNSWTGITSGIPSQGLYQGQTLFVVVSNSGTLNRVMTSLDCINWTIRTSAVDNNWSSITYGVPSSGIYTGVGLFVAVSTSGTGNRVMTSPDGITWTIRTSAADNSWRSVTYGNGLFVAVSGSATSTDVMTSPDGITWTTRTPSVNNDWSAITYGNGLFVVVSNTGLGSGNRVMTSSDGITWTTRTTPADNNWWGVVYGIPSTGPFSGKGLFVAVSNTGTLNRVMTSPDGFTWTLRVTPIDIGFRSVAFGNGYFVATGESGPTGMRAMISTDGINFIAKTTPEQNFNNVTYGTPSSGLYTGQGIFVGVSITGTGNRVMTANFIDTYTTNSLAIGNGAVANGNNSVAIGAGAIASGSNQIVLGTSNETISIPGSLKLKSTQSISSEVTSVEPNALQSHKSQCHRVGGNYP